jgi:ketosteroid isomerase-like protein
MSAPAAAGDATRELITRVYAAAAAGDMAVLQEILAPDLTVEEPNFLPYGGSYRGLGDFAALFGEVAKVIDLSALKLEGLAVDGDIAYGRVRAPLLDGSGYAAILEEWHVRDDRVVGARVFWLNDPSRS